MKKTLFRGLLGAALTILVCLPAASRGKGPKKTREFTDADFRTEKILEALPIRATFLDEVSWDIPHQNWGVKEWDADFKAMKQMGINTVVLIRAGLGSWIAAPFDCLLRTGKVKYPPVDLVEMFLALSDKYGMDFWFGTYDSCYHWHVGEYEKEIELNMQLIDEVWAKYGHHKSFRGWYLSQEISRRVLGEMDRGVTALKGRGQYSGDDIDVLLCVVPRLEVPRLKRIIVECDDKAFVIATDVREALGEGFTPHK